MYEKIRDEVTRKFKLTDLSNEQLIETISKIVDLEAKGKYISIDQKARVVDAVYSTFRGFGLLDSLVADEEVTELMINGPDNIFVERAGKLEKIPNSFPNEKALENTIQRIVGLAGREVNRANPIVDTRLPDGSRVSVVLPPIAINGPIVTIRKFSDDVITIDKLIKFGAINEEAAKFLEVLVQSKYNIFISGGTGTGKTTFLNALSDFIPKDERIITIEDTAELKISGVNNLVRLETRNANSAGVGVVTIGNLIKSSLRMRPERIIVGEVRGEEALDMLQAMNTGHSGAISTGHANSSLDMISRLETMALSSSIKLPIEAIRHQISSAIDIIVHLGRLRDKSRKVIEISEVLPIENDVIKLNQLFVFTEDKTSTGEKVIGKLLRTENPLKEVQKLYQSGKISEIR